MKTIVVTPKLAPISSCAPRRQEKVDYEATKSVRGQSVGKTKLVDGEHVEGGLWLPKDGVGLTSRIDKFLNNKFKNLANLKDKFSLSDFEDI